MITTSESRLATPVLGAVDLKKIDQNGRGASPLDSPAALPAPPVSTIVSIEDRLALLREEEAKLNIRLIEARKADEEKEKLELKNKLDQLPGLFGVSDLGAVHTLIVQILGNGANAPTFSASLTSGASKTSKAAQTTKRPYHRRKYKGFRFSEAEKTDLIAALKTSKRTVAQLAKKFKVSRQTVYSYRNPLLAKGKIAA